MSMFWFQLLLDFRLQSVCSYVPVYAQASTPVRPTLNLFPFHLSFCFSVFCYNHAWNKVQNVSLKLARWKDFPCLFPTLFNLLCSLHIFFPVSLNLSLVLFDCCYMIDLVSAFWASRVCSLTAILLSITLTQLRFV